MVSSDKVDLGKQSWMCGMGYWSGTDSTSGNNNNNKDL